MKHRQMVKELVKNPSVIRDNMGDSDVALIHMAMGIAGEAGELLDAIKKCTMYHQPLDVKHVIEELGDIEFYMEGLRQELDLDRSHVLSENVMKLSKRYSDFKYTDAKAKARADKV